jgi:hypothetical protein
MLDCVEKPFRREAPLLLVRLCHGRQGRRRQGSGGAVVEPDD